MVGCYDYCGHQDESSSLRTTHAAWRTEYTLLVLERERIDGRRELWPANELRLNTLPEEGKRAFQHGILLSIRYKLCQRLS